MQQLDIQALCPMVVDTRKSQSRSFIDRVVQHLHLESVARVVHRSNSIDQAFDHVQFVKHR